MGLWQFLAGEEGDKVDTQRWRSWRYRSKGEESDKVDTVPGGTHTDNPTSTENPTVIRRTDANGSTRKIIFTNGGNYNERIDGDYTQGQTKPKTKSE